MNRDRRPRSSPRREYALKSPRPDLGQGWRVEAYDYDAYGEEIDYAVLSEHIYEEDARRAYREATEHCI